MAKDYYSILGVPLNAASDEIRSAFHKLASRCHTDRRSESSPGTFLDISEAYDVLSDPVQRSRHDRELRRRRQRVAVVDDSSRIPGSESLISEPVSIAGRPEIVRPSYEALWDRLRSNFVDLGTPKAEREEPLNFELILSREEAERGVLVPFQVPIFSICFQCGGMGRDWLVPCAECGGEGQILDRDSVDVKVPGGVPDGTVIDISLERLGVHNLWLRVHVRIERH